MTNSLLLPLLVSWLSTNTACPRPSPTTTPCVIVVVDCDSVAACGDQNTCGTDPPPVCPPNTPPAAGAITPEPPPEIQLTRMKPKVTAPALDAGATELALFTTARTLPKNADLVEMTIIGVSEGLPEAWLDLVGVKVGLTDHLQIGFRTSLRLLTELQTEPAGLLVAAIVGFSFKYQLWRDGDHSLAFNYVFPYTELIWSRHAGGGSFTIAGGTSLFTLAEMIDGDDHRDVFLRAGGVWRFSKTMRFIAEAGAFHYLTDPETVMFGSAGLRLLGKDAYLDAFVGVGGEPGDDGAVFFGLAVGWQH